MPSEKWPAWAIQSIFLAANAGFIYGGEQNNFILASFAVLIFLFMLQATTTNVRFIYLYPVQGGQLETPDGEKKKFAYPAPMLDTLILRFLIGTAVWLFFAGVTSRWYLATAIVAGGPVIAFVWRRFFDVPNQRLLNRLVQRNLDRDFSQRRKTDTGAETGGAQMPDVNERLLEHRKRMMDKYGEASYGLWGALLTLNGLLVTSAAIAASTERYDRWFLTAVILTATAASSCLVICFSMMQSAYDDIGQSLEKNLERIETGNDIQTDPVEINKKAAEGDRRRILQKWAVGLTIVEVVQLLLIVTID